MAEVVEWSSGGSTATAEIDFADARGQEAVKRAIIVAAAGAQFAHVVPKWR